ncbi:unnamed protein product [Clonostachys rhizophaga]|uniref:Uncharacterized protein n=1 Tax=Clonostachys rhizophaga TaxID=160324 RepID=A0A9N9VX47_9HYPO|nr:unnamed protein product [Clonostachys rhizophaga]
MLPTTAITVLGLATLGTAASILPIKVDQHNTPQLRNPEINDVRRDPRGVIQVQECTVTGCDKNDKRSSNSDRTRPWHFSSNLGDRNAEAQEAGKNGEFVSRGFQAQECGVTGCLEEVRDGARHLEDYYREKRQE